jgi:hypothetical protein
MEASTAVAVLSGAAAPSMPTWLQVLSMLVFVESILVLLANPVTLLAIIRSNLAKKSAAHFFIGVLCVTDFLGGLSFFLLQVMLFAIESSGMSTVLVELNWLVNIFNVLAVPASLVNSFLIGVDRFLAISYPTKYMQQMNNKKAALMVMGQWLFVGLVVLPPSIYKRSRHGIQFTVHPPDIYPESYTAYVTTPLAFILLIANALLYARILQLHRSHSMKVIGGQANQDQVSKRSRRLTRLALIVVSVLIACWAPVTIMTVVPPPSPNPYESNAFNLIYNICFVVLLVPSYMNNVIYAWRHQDYKRAYLKLIGRKVDAEVSLASGRSGPE